MTTALSRSGKLLATIIVGHFLFCQVAAAQISETLKTSPFFLIAHRGGIVDSSRAENSLPALIAAIDKGYNMVEVDLRVTKDRELIIQHDPNFRKYFHDDRQVEDMTWEEISRLRSDRGGSGVLKFEEVAKRCSGKIQLMIDNKIKGNDTVLFYKLIELLKKYNLYSTAFMIGTSESTEFFTGKIKLSCTRKQLEANRRRGDYNPTHYYLFGADLTKNDVDWAKEHYITVVGVVNEWRYKRLKWTDKQIAADIQRQKETGVTYFQIDSKYQDKFFE